MRMAMRPLILATIFGLSAVGCGKAAESGASKRKDGPEVADDPEVELTARGFLLFPGDLRFEDVGNPVKTSRFVVTVLSAKDEPVVGAEVRVQRLDGDAKSKKRTVLHKIVKKNARSNVFTVMIQAGQDYEISVSAAGFANGLKRLAFDSSNSVDVAFPFALEPGESKTLSDVSPSSHPAEVELVGLTRCDIRRDRDDYTRVLALISEKLPAEYAAIKANHLDRGHDVISCSGIPFPQITVQFYDRTSQTKVDYVVADGTSLKDYWYGLDDVASAAAPTDEVPVTPTTQGLPETPPSPAVPIAVPQMPADKSIFSDEVRSAYLVRANAAIAAARLLCSGEPRCAREIDTSAGRTRVVLFGSGSHSMAQGDCTAFTAGDGYANMIVLEGAGRDKTTLDYSVNGLEACAGFAVYADRPGAIIVRNLTIRGGYSGWEKPLSEPRRTVTHLPAEAWPAGSVRLQWQKGLVSRFAGSHIHAEHVGIDNFYYGMAAEEQATGFAYQVTVTEAGDAGFFAYFGGKLHLDHTVSRFTSDVARGLGFGYVAETLNHAGDTGFPLCAKEASAEPARTAELFNECVIRESLAVTGAGRSIIRAYNSVAHDNLLGGFMANSGADIDTTDAKAHGHFNRYNDGTPTHVLADSNPSSPNVYQLGHIGAGYGFMARHGSTLTAVRGMSWNNFIGYQAFFDASMYTPNARAWDNLHYGFHAVRKGRINATAAQAFGAAQKYGFAADASDSMIDVTDTLTVDNFRTIPGFCVWPEVDPCPHFVTPVRQTIDFSSPIFPSATVGNLGLFYRP